MNYELTETSSGFFVKSNTVPMMGPFSSPEDAMAYIDGMLIIESRINAGLF